MAGGIAAQSEQSVALIAAVNLLNYAAGNVGETVRFDRTLDFDARGLVQRRAAPDRRRCRPGKVDVLVVGDANPAYAVPALGRLRRGDGQGAVHASRCRRVLDETSERCDLILPATHPLETLGDAETTRGVCSILQPGMQKVPVFDAAPGRATR